MKQEKKNYTCRYCNETFYLSRAAFSNHLRWCKCNPNYINNLNKHHDRCKKVVEQNKIIHDANLKTYIINCKYCGKEILLRLTEDEFNKHKYSNFCSRSCANTHICSNETKSKISKGVLNSPKYKKHCSDVKEKIENEIKLGLRKKTLRQLKYVCGSKDLDEKYPEISKHKIISWFRNLIPFGLNYDTVGTSELINEYFKVKTLLYDEYINNSLSPKDIWIKYNCAEYINHSETILHILKGMGIKTRNISDATVNSYLQGKLGKSNKSNQYKQNWHTTWEGKQVYLRSSYEEDYARELDKKRIKYDVEFKRIKYWNPEENKYKCTIPDFYLNDFNTIVEIKSLYTLDIKKLKYRFDEYKRLGYNVKLIVEHIEVDLYSLDENKKYKVYNDELVVKDKVYTPRRVNSHWISNLTLKCSMRCNEEDMNTFLNDGWVIGRKFNFN